MSQVHQLGPPFVFFGTSEQQSWKVGSWDRWKFLPPQNNEFLISSQRLILKFHIKLDGSFLNEFPIRSRTTAVLSDAPWNNFVQKSNWHNWWMVWLDMFMTLGCFSFLGTSQTGSSINATRYLQNGDCRKMLVARQGGQAGKPTKWRLERYELGRFIFVASGLSDGSSLPFFLKLAHSLQGCAIGFINFAQVSRGLFAGPKFYGICAIAWFRQE